MTKETICGMTESEIRKDYFAGKLKDLICKIQAKQKYDEKDIGEFGLFLEYLRTEEIDFTMELGKTYKGKIADDNKPPTVEELNEGISDKGWREKADQATEYIDKSLTGLRHLIAEKKNLPGTFWLDKATTFLTYLEVIDKDRIFKDQLYRARMTNIIDKYGVSRKEAEERAKLTKEYSDYKNSILLRERIDEFINLCKKKDADRY